MLHFSKQRGGSPIWPFFLRENLLLIIPTNEPPPSPSDSVSFLSLEIFSVADLRTEKILLMQKAHWYRDCMIFIFLFYPWYHHPYGGNTYNLVQISQLTAILTEEKRESRVSNLASVLILKCFHFGPMCSAAGNSSFSFLIYPSKSRPPFPNHTVDVGLTTAPWNWRLYQD